ncbi:MAG: ABC transporter permease, partial [Cytophagales bacterium]|nr:ABC transporter permease [Cytophagales bacterium]
MTVRYTHDHPKEAVKLVESKWKEVAPNEPFEFTFLDENFDEMYRAEQRLGVLFSIFTGLAIFIACLGLFGLAAFTAEQRTKEIGIRKAMGASSFNIIRLLSSEFVKFVGIAFIISIFPAYYVISGWLDNFAYRIEISWWIFGLSGIVALVVALLTVSFQSVKASMLDPATTLRYE